MGQLSLQRFEYRGAISKAEFDKAWGGYILLEVEDPGALAQYQMHHTNSYAHLARITFEPVFDMDAAFAPVVNQIKAKGKKPTRS